MSTPSKRKGDAWERALVDHFRKRGFSQAARLRQTGSRDEGDLTIGSLWWAIEAKDDKSLSPWAMASQAAQEADNSGKPFGVAIRKSPRRPTREATVTMTLDTWLALVALIESFDS